MKLLLVLCLLAPAVGAWASAPRSALEETATEAAPLVTWEELRGRSTRYIGRPVRLEMQFHSQLATWNPFLTRFGPATFRAFRFWSDEQFLWDEGAHASPAARVFVRRGALIEEVLGNAAVFRRFELRVIVRETFGGEPWAEVIAVTPLAEHVTEAGLIHARRFVELCESGSTRLAETECERALAGSWPAKARSELVRLRDALHEPD
ncbi:MAG: hypothetical protein ACKVWV_19325 [Planctomycetota bacterium]